MEGVVPHDYPTRVTFQNLNDREIPIRFYYECNPNVEYWNPYSERLLTDSGTGGVASDGIARAHELHSMFNVVTTGAEPQYQVAKARRDQELSITILEAARRGGWLRSDQLEEETEWERSQHEAFRKQWGVDPIKDLPTVLKRV